MKALFIIITLCMTSQAQGKRAKDYQASHSEGE